MTITSPRRRLAALGTTLLCAALALSACGSSTDATDGDATGSSGVTSNTPAGDSTSADAGDGDTSGAETSTDTASDTREVTADNGTVTVPADPQRVAVLGNAVLPYLDLGGTPVAVTDLRQTAQDDLPADQQAAYKAATSVGPSGGEADIEKLAALEPDVIVIAVPDSDFETLKDQLTAIAPTVWLGFESDWKFRADALADATGKTSENDEQKAQYDTLVTKIKQEYGDALTGEKVVEAYSTAGGDPGTYGINSSLCAEVARDEGIIDFGPTEYGVSYEQIGSLSDYDPILYSVGIDGEPTETITPLLETDAWQALPAVQSGHAQPVYCPWGRSFGYMAQYLDGLEQALATLPKGQ